MRPPLVRCHTVLMKWRSLYLLLTVAGVVIPYLAFGPWVLQHGLNLRLMLAELLANRIGTFFGADIAVSALVVIVFAAAEHKRLGKAWWMPVLAVLVFGVSAGLPLLLYFRETQAPR